MKGDHMIILNPDINDLLNDKIYKLELNDKTYYVPLWYNEVIFEDNSGNDIIVNCIFDLPENIYIDDDNMLHVKIIHPIQSILENKRLEFKIGEKMFEIESLKIKITKYQILKLNNQGILKENTNNLFDNLFRQNIYIHLTLE